MLFIVSTPIGNLGDITLRALDTLKKVDLILAEDTRRTGILLKKYDIKNRIASYNDINKRSRTNYALSLLTAGKNIALVSDSGTPGINDPGFFLVRECVSKGINVSPIPGANAAISALVCSGLPTDKFSFIGFVPKKEKQKEKLFEMINGREETFIMYESPHRINKTLRTMENIIPLKQLVIARELTKKFESFIRGTVSEVLISLNNIELKGEIVLIIR